MANLLKVLYSNRPRFAAVEEFAVHGSKTVRSAARRITRKNISSVSPLETRV